MYKKVNKWLETFWLKQQIKKPQNKIVFFFTLVISYVGPTGLTLLSLLFLAVVLKNWEALTYPTRSLVASLLLLAFGLGTTIFTYKEDKKKGYVDAVYQRYLNRVEELKKKLEEDGTK